MPSSKRQPSPRAVRVSVLLCSAALLEASIFPPLAQARAFDPPVTDVECTSEDPERAVESVLLPGGGEVETIHTPSSMHVNLYLDGELVLSVSEQDGYVDAEPTEYGLALEPKQALQLRDEVVSHFQEIMKSPAGCSGPLASKADETAKCGLIGIGAGILGTMACGVICGAFGGSLGVACKWLVEKVCEENPEGC